eukprot:TRINITY_DN36728_c0_g1_i1.p1 TRINITY_DN36728_c0_g1~~TRINITY_DN36728_c0_g1_i1.p1  ORF type:complete len:496 (+),score=60.68 TRINITY_DN36728_c0_g1_i1:148-1488(+)
MSAVLPLLPAIQVQYFCGDSTEDTSACSASASMAHGLAQSLYFLGIFALSPWYGDASDRYGRKYLFIFGFIGRMFPIWCLWVWPGQLPLFYVVTALGGLAPAADAMFFAMIADLVPKEVRLQNFGLGGALFFSAFSLGAGLSSHLQPLVGPLGVLDVSVKISVSATLFIFVVLPETAPTRGLHGEMHAAMPDASHDQKQNLLGFFRLPGFQSEAGLPPATPKVVRSKSLVGIMSGVGQEREVAMLRSVAWIGLFSFLPQDGVISVGLFYAKSKLALDAKGLSEVAARMLCVVGASSALWQTLGLCVLRRACSDKARMYLVLLFFDFLHLVGYAVVWAPWVLIANATIVGAPVALPTVLRAAVSEALPPSAQGRGSGIVASVTGLCSCIGPIIFGWLYLLGSKLSVPACPFYVGMMSLLVSCWLTISWMSTVRAEMDDECHKKVLLG